MGDAPGFSPANGPQNYVLYFRPYCHVYCIPWPYHKRRRPHNFSTKISVHLHSLSFSSSSSSGPWPLLLLLLLPPLYLSKTRRTLSLFSPPTMTDTTDDIAEEISFQSFDDDCKLLGNLLNEVLQREVGHEFTDKLERTRILAQVSLSLSLSLYDDFHFLSFFLRFLEEIRSSSTLPCFAYSPHGDHCIIVLHVCDSVDFRGFLWIAVFFSENEGSDLCKRRGSFVLRFLVLINE